MREAKIPVFAVSTWFVLPRQWPICSGLMGFPRNTDYVPISAGDVDNVVAVLSRDGWQFV